VVWLRFLVLVLKVEFWFLGKKMPREVCTFRGSDQQKGLLMERIINGMLFEGKRVADCYDVRTWTCNGVMERSARQVIEWTEAPIFPDLPYMDYKEPDPEKDADWLAEQKEKHLKQAASRAKTMCRRFIITERFDEMLTLTYRKNQPDRALCKKHFSIWSKRMKRALGDFRYCASFEVQERGSMHVHIATHKLPVNADYKRVRIKAWQLGTKIWRDVVGDYGGLCFVGGKTKFGASGKRSMSLAKMAAYVSKYILKDYALSPEETNRYSRSNGQVGGEVHTMRLNASMPEIIATCFECNDGDVIVSHRVSYWSDSWWLCTEAGVNHV